MAATGSFSLLHETPFCNRQMSQVSRNDGRTKVGRWHSPVNPIEFVVLCLYHFYVCVSLLCVGIMFIWVYHFMYHLYMCGSFLKCVLFFFDDDVGYCT